MSNNKSNEYSCHWDWFTFRFKLPNQSHVFDSDFNDSLMQSAVHMILEKLKLDDATWYDGGTLTKYHYEKSMILSGESTIIIGFDDKYSRDNTVMVQMSGSGYQFWLRYLEAKGYDVLNIERDLFNDNDFKMEPTRVDIALDLFNFGKEYSPLYVNKVTEMGNFIGRFRPKFVHEYSPNGTIKDDSRFSTEKEGTTLYFGSMQNPKKLLRIYNKKAERLSKTSEHYGCSSWYRWEFELKKQSAVDFWNLYFEQDQNLLSAWRYWLSANYRWIEKIGPKQKNRSRYPNANFYANLVDGFEDAKAIKHERRAMTYERTERYINNAIPSALKLIQHDVMKYQQNGLDYDTAKQTALVRFMSKLTNKLESGEVSYDDVANYFLDENEDELFKQANELSNEQLDHRNGF